MAVTQWIAVEENLSDIKSTEFLNNILSLLTELAFTAGVSSVFSSNVGVSMLMLNQGELIWGLYNLCGYIGLCVGDTPPTPHPHQTTVCAHTMYS